MAGGNGIEHDDDEENGYGGNRVQPIASTPKKEEEGRGQGKKKKKKKLSDSVLGRVLAMEELVSPKVWRASAAELIGTAVLVFAMDTIVISSYETKTETPNLVMSILIGVTVTILLLATFPISGGHLNPVITVAALLTGLVSVPRAAIYILSQCAGAILGALALKAVVSSAIEDTVSLGGCTLTVVAPGPNGAVVVGIGTAQALWLEIICTFIFLFASIWMAFDGRQARAVGKIGVFVIIGAVVGLIVFISTTVTAARGYAGVGMNPARCLGPAVVRGGPLWSGLWVFWAGPGIACVGFWVYTKIIPKENLHE